MGGAQVLVVDDEPDVAALLALDLEAAGYAVSSVADGAAALDHLRSEGADAVVLDVLMPGLDGWQVLAALQADPVLVDIPVVMLTARSTESDIIRGQLSGATRYLTKPYDRDYLVGTLREILQPSDDAARERRRDELAGLLVRLAELETGRRRSRSHVHLSRLERIHPPGPVTTVDPRLLSRLTAREREVAALFAAGVGARTIAAHLGSSRANVYATRKRIGRKLSVTTDLVAETARALGLDAEAPVTPDTPAAS